MPHLCNLQCDAGKIFGKCFNLAVKRDGFIVFGTNITNFAVDILLLSLLGVLTQVSLDKAHHLITGRVSLLHVVQESVPQSRGLHNPPPLQERSEGSDLRPLLRLGDPGDHVEDAVSNVQARDETLHRVVLPDYEKTSGPQHSDYGGEEGNYCVLREVMQPLVEAYQIR